MLAGTILISSLVAEGPWAQGPGFAGLGRSRLRLRKPRGRVKDLAIVIETRQTAGVKSKSLYVVLLRLSKEKLSFGPEEHRYLEETEER